MNKKTIISFIARLASILALFWLLLSSIESIGIYFELPKPIVGNIFMGFVAIVMLIWLMVMRCSDE